MPIFRCKMCGGTLEIHEHEGVAECEYCGTLQTLPKNNDETIRNLFNRANNLRFKCEFDKAERIYEKILELDNAEAEAHWGIILCKYGIEYVEDPKTLRRIPTCHRTSFESITASAEYLAAMDCADGAQKQVYEQEAKAIDEIQRSILSIVKNEKPFDVFICYKETDESGKRTVDSAIANDIYYQLTQEGLKVFYAAITLEDKLGQEYEPYIFAALNSAKVMLAIGTKPEYFEAVWVKNEWSRFMKLMKTDRSKLLIPCYKDMDAYDLPEEFAHLQAQDMGKIGFINDVVRGIRKVLAPAKAEAAPAAVKTAVSFGNEPNTTQLLRRAFMFLEDEEWESADEYCEKVLDFDVENAEAYLGKLLAELRIPGRDELLNAAEPFDGNNLYKKILRFGSEKLCAELEEANKAIRERKEENRRNEIYNSGCSLMKNARTEEDFRKAAEIFGKISGFRDAEENRVSCLYRAEEVKKQLIYDDACAYQSQKTFKGYEAAAVRFRQIPGFRDSEKQEAFCRGEIERFKAEAEKERIEKERKAEEQRKAAEIRKQRNKKLAAVFVSAVAVVVAAAIVFVTVIQPMMNYNAAVALFEEEKFEEAIAAFEAMGGYKDSAEQIKNCKEGISEREYQKAVAIMEEGRYEEAIVAFEKLRGYKDSVTKIAESEELIKEGIYQEAISLIKEGKRVEALIIFHGIRDYKDSISYIEKLAEKNTIAAATMHSVAVKEDGTVVAKGSNKKGQLNVSKWTDIVAVEAGEMHTVGLKADGTVVATGDSFYKQCNVSSWEKVISVCAGDYHTVGLKADGTVVATGRNAYRQCEVSEWKDIVAIAAGADYTVGLKSDGTVEAAGNNSHGQRNVLDWTDIIAIAAGKNHAVGLKADGTVVAAGYNGYGQCNVDGYTDIVAIAAGSNFTVMLKADGTVIVKGASAYGQSDVSGWTDIVAIAAGANHTIGLKADGTVVATGSNGSGQCKVSGWKNIMLPGEN